VELLVKPVSLLKFIRCHVNLLKPENPKYRAITITEETDFTIWGVVTQIIINPKKIK